jgi:hypothetical protein
MSRTRSCRTPTTRRSPRRRPRSTASLRPRSMWRRASTGTSFVLQEPSSKHLLNERDLDYPSCPDA